MDLRLVTEPSIEPVTVAEAKLHLRVDTSSDDGSIGNMISAARRWAEDYTGRRFIKQTWDFWLDRFPMSNKMPWWDGIQDGRLSDFIGPAVFIQIPLAPVSSFKFLKTYDDDGTAYEAVASTLVPAYQAEPFRLALKNGQSWPATFLRPVQGIQIRLDVGYGALASQVPMAIKQAILEYVAGMYDHRGDTDYSVPLMAKQLLDPYRTTVKI